MAETSKNTRREFLAGRVTAESTGPLTSRLDAERGPPSILSPITSDSGDSSYLLRFSRRAMACQFEFILPAGRYLNDSETALAALDLVDQLEEQLTVYRDTSEVAAINRMAASGPVPVEPRLFGLLELAIELYQRTLGAYDVTAGPLSKVWGFYRRQVALPGADEIAAALERVGSRHLELDAENLTIRFHTSGVELNLGSIGKGYALDRCGELFRTAGIDRVLLHGGQSSVLALGGDKIDTDQVQSEVEPRPRDASPRIDDCPDGAISGEAGWTVGIGDPARPGKRLAVIQLRNRALGTSGSSVQFFRQAGKRYGHILDPRTGWPADGLSSATVIAASAAEADAYSTAAFVLGLEGALELCETAGLSGIFIESPRAGTKHRIHTCGLGPEEFWLVEPSGSILA